jgi:hypothetical protein
MRIQDESSEGPGAVLGFLAPQRVESLVAFILGILFPWGQPQTPRSRCTRFIRVLRLLYLTVLQAIISD